MKEDKNIKKKVKKIVFYITLFSILYGLENKNDLANKLKNNISLIMNDQTEDKVKLLNSDDLDKYINNNVTFSNIREVIDNNKNLKQDEKDNLMTIIDKIKEKADYIDLKYLYQNCKSLKITRNINKDENILGFFNKSTTTINISCDDFHVFSHEVLHMTNLICLKKGDTFISNKDSWDEAEFKPINEGFTEWFNNYLFNDEIEAYKITSSDINIFKYILNYSDKDLIKMFINGNSKVFSDKLKKYMNESEFNELMKIYLKEDENQENITIDDITKKYSILLNACIKSRKDSFDVNDLYVIQNLLHDSYKNYNYLKNDYDSLFQLKKYIFNESIKKIENVNNEIILSNYAYIGDVISYCNFDNMYLIHSKDNNTGYQVYMLGEKYIDIDNKINYYVDDEFISYDDKNYNEIVPLNSLFNDKNISNNAITLDEAIDKYEKMYNIKSSGKKYKKIK